jgi:hypothetical protein
VTVCTTNLHTRTYAIPESSLARWAKERLRQEPRADGSVVYSFTLSGSTCTNMGQPLEVVMTVATDGQGRIQQASSSPAPGDTGCNAMCGALGNGRMFLAQAGHADEAIGLTLEEAAFRNWLPEISGCFCSEGNRRHKWRNVFQAIHFAVTHADD